LSRAVWGPVQVRERLPAVQTWLLIIDAGAMPALRPVPRWAVVRTFASLTAHRRLRGPTNATWPVRGRLLSRPPYQVTTGREE
jgi:hypothetical protein